MPKKWNTIEKEKKRVILEKLYIKENKTIKEIGLLLILSEKTIFKRLLMLDIKTNRKQKLNYSNQRNDVIIPINKSDKLAELFGILLGDGNISLFQIKVTLSKEEKSYSEHVANLFKINFNASPKILVRKNGHLDIYLNSVKLSKWLMDEGLVFNKVKSQVSPPLWIFRKKEYMNSFLRGFFDTDGSLYKLRYGLQMSFSNRSMPLLVSLQKTLNLLQYKPSEISSWKIYLTSKKDISRFFKEIKPKNQKHLNRFMEFKK